MESEFSESKSNKQTSTKVSFSSEPNVVHVYDHEEYQPDPEEERRLTARDFLVSLITLSIGFGNIYRFPFAAYRSKGGAFLYPYLIMHTFIGRPMYFLQLALGQFTSAGQVKIWAVAPIFKGVGYGSMIATIAAMSFYASTMAVLLFYFFSSFKTSLPWATCNEKWVASGDDWGDLHYTLNDTTLVCNSSDPTAAFDAHTGEKASISLAQLYFKNEVLKSKDHIADGLGFPDWKLALFLLLTWLCVWRILLRRMTPRGKMAYAFALIPYFLLMVLFARAVTLPNAWEGIKFFIVPNFPEMLHARVWYAAVTQCLFSLHTGFGPLIMLGSTNRFDHNIYRDTWIVSTIDLFSSFLAAITVFSFLGNLAENLGVGIEQVTYAENELAFIVFAQGIATFSWLPQLYSITFYLALFVLGAVTTTSYVGAVVTVICEQFPKIPRIYVASAVSFMGFAIGLIYVTPGGSLMVRLADYYGARMVIYFMTAAEVVGVAWVYGADKFLQDVQFMLGIRLGWFWKFCWKYFIPGSLAGIMLSAFSQGLYSPLYKGERVSGLTVFFGWMFTLVAVSALPICALHSILSVQSGGIKERVKKAMTPTEDWGPRETDVRREWLQFKEKMS